MAIIGNIPYFQTYPSDGNEEKLRRNHSAPHSEVLEAIESHWPRRLLEGTEEHLGIGWHIHVITCAHDFRGFIYNNVEGWGRFTGLLHASLSQVSDQRSAAIHYSAKLCFGFGLAWAWLKSLWFAVACYGLPWTRRATPQGLWLLMPAHDKFTRFADLSGDAICNVMHVVSQVRLQSMQFWTAVVWDQNLLSKLLLPPQLLLRLLWPAFRSHFLLQQLQPGSQPATTLSRDQAIIDGFGKTDWFKNWISAWGKDMNDILQ